MGKRIFQIGAVLCILTAVTGAFLLFHQTLYRQARVQSSYQVAVADFAIIPPPHYQRIEFLDEVRYLASWPPYFRLLDDALPSRLAKGFGRHPWVEEVKSVRIQPSKTVTVELKYREPVLAVKLGDVWRAVDRKGVLLPRNAPVADLPKYQGNAEPPIGPAGAKWGDPAVEKAAAEAAAMH